MGNMLKHMMSNIDIFMCPSCNGDLELTNDGINCISCHNTYRVENDIPLLFCPNERDDSKGDVTEVVKEFYEKSPFPNYEDVENIGSLVQKAQRTFFANLLN